MQVSKKSWSFVIRDKLAAGLFYLPTNNSFSSFYRCRFSIITQDTKLVPFLGNNYKNSRNLNAGIECLLFSTLFLTSSQISLWCHYANNSNFRFYVTSVFTIIIGGTDSLSRSNGNFFCLHSLKLFSMNIKVYIEWVGLLGIHLCQKRRNNCVQEKKHLEFLIVPV
mgnify:CR=1 FL=1